MTAMNNTPFLAIALPHQSSAEDEDVSFALPENAFTDVDGDALTQYPPPVDEEPALRAKKLDRPSQLDKYESRNSVRKAMTGFPVCLGGNNGLREGCAFSAVDAQHLTSQDECL